MFVTELVWPLSPPPEIVAPNIPPETLLPLYPPIRFGAVEEVSNLKAPLIEPLRVRLPVMLWFPEKELPTSRRA